MNRGHLRQELGPGRVAQPLIGQHQSDVRTSVSEVTQRNERVIRRVLGHYLEVGPETALKDIAHATEGVGIVVDRDDRGRTERTVLAHA